MIQRRKHTYNIQEMLESIRNSPMSWIFEDFFGVDTGLGFNIWRSACQQSGMDLSHDTLILKKMDPCMTTSIDGAINGFQKPTVESRFLILQQKLVVWNFPILLAILRTWPFWDGLNGCWWPAILGIKKVTAWITCSPIGCNLQGYLTNLWREAEIVTSLSHEKTDPWLVDLYDIELSWILFHSNLFYSVSCHEFWFGILYCIVVYVGFRTGLLSSSLANRKALEHPTELECYKFIGWRGRCKRAPSLYCYTGRICACVNVYWKSFLFSMITKGSTLTKPPIRTTVFFVFDYNTSDEHRIYFNQLESEFLLGIFEVFIHSTSQLDVWRASTKVNLFIPKVPPHKNNLQNPWNPKSYSPIFFFGQPPAPSFPLKDPRCILDDGESFA